MKQNSIGYIFSAALLYLIPLYSSTPWYEQQINTQTLTGGSGNPGFSNGVNYFNFQSVLNFDTGSQLVFPYVYMPTGYTGALTLDNIQKSGFSELQTLYTNFNSSLGSAIANAAGRIFQGTLMNYIQNVIFPKIDNFTPTPALINSGVYIQYGISFAPPNDWHGGSPLYKLGGQSHYGSYVNTGQVQYEFANIIPSTMTSFYDSSAAGFMTQDWIGVFESCYQGQPYVGSGATSPALSENVAELIATLPGLSNNYITNHFIPALNNIKASLSNASTGGESGTNDSWNVSLGSSTISFPGTTSALQKCIITEIFNNTTTTFNIYQQDANNNQSQIGSLTPGMNNVALYAAIDEDIVFQPAGGATQQASWRISFKDNADMNAWLGKNINGSLNQSCQESEEGAQYLCVSVESADLSFNSALASMASELTQIQSIKLSPETLSYVTLQVDETATTFCPMATSTNSITNAHFNTYTIDSANISSTVNTLAQGNNESLTIPMFLPSITLVQTLDTKTINVNAPLLLLPSSITSATDTGSQQVTYWIQFLNIVLGAIQTNYGYIENYSYLISSSMQQNIYPSSPVNSNIVSQATTAASSSSPTTPIPYGNIFTPNFIQSVLSTKSDFYPVIFSDQADELTIDLQNSKGSYQCESIDSIFGQNIANIDTSYPYCISGNVGRFSFFTPGHATEFSVSSFAQLFTAAAWLQSNISNPLSVVTTVQNQYTTSSALPLTVSPGSNQFNTVALMLAAMNTNNSSGSVLKSSSMSDQITFVNNQGVTLLSKLINNSITATIENGTLTFQGSANGLNGPTIPPLLFFYVLSQSSQTMTLGSTQDVAVADLVVYAWNASFKNYVYPQSSQMPTITLPDGSTSTNPFDATSAEEYMFYTLDTLAQKANLLTSTFDVEVTENKSNNTPSYKITSDDSVSAEINPENLVILQASPVTNMIVNETDTVTFQSQDIIAAICINNDVLLNDNTEAYIPTDIENKAISIPVIKKGAKTTYTKETALGKLELQNPAATITSLSLLIHQGSTQSTLTFSAENLATLVKVLQKNIACRITLSTSGSLSLSTIPGKSVEDQTTITSSNITDLNLETVSIAGSTPIIEIQYLSSDSSTPYSAYVTYPSFDVYSSININSL